jgi:two-component system phosphate regulon sensor histidine kinase PhoR
MAVFQKTLRLIQAVYVMLWRRRSIAVRALLCWAVGAIFISIDQNGHHDLRYQLRGPRPGALDPRIVIIDVSERDWMELDPQTRNTLRPLKEVSEAGDQLFWNTSIWEKILSRVLADLPVAVGVTFYFGDGVRVGRLGPATRALFEDVRVVWGADLDSAGRALIPVFATTYNRNTAIRSLRVDDDGTLRRYPRSLIQMPHLGTRLAELAKGAERIRPQSLGEIQNLEPAFDTGSSGDFGTPVEINFIGASGSFPTVSVRDLLEGRVPPEAFHGKIVIIGNRSDYREAYSTPLGKMSRAEAIANITDNILRQKVPRRMALGVSFFLSAMIVFAAVLFILSYPQPVVIFGITFGGLCWLSLSAWLFDSFALWVPAVGPVVQVGVTYIVFLSHQVAANEARNWRLQQDRKAAEELEQLKTNFVSMMSHDLKTPIAKIQAICDRLMAKSMDSEIADDLRNLRRSSDDLYRYIRSILQVTKIEAREFAISREPVDVNEAIDRVLARLTPLAEEKNISIFCKLEPLFSIEADPTLLEEMIHNLVENAIKYTPKGGQIHVHSSEEDERIVVSVLDSGPGIPIEDQDRVWNKFTRGLKTESTATGSGLGLYLVKYFVELHGGTVFLESPLGSQYGGAGTKIGFRVPLGE